MKISTEPVKGKDLQPGDLFSTYGQEYWDNFDKNGSIGERVYIRTNAPASVAPDGALTVYRLTIER